MNNDFSKALQGFDKVWRRVQQAKPQPGSPQQKGSKRPPMPPRCKNNSRARRFEL